MCDANNFYTMKDVPVSVPCEKPCYNGPFRKVPPQQMNFVVQWYVEKYEHQKQFLLSYYDYDGTIEMKDLSLNRRFLRRLKADTVKLEDLYLGGKLMILSRPMIIVEYGDNFTQDYVDSKTERAFLLVLPEAVEHLASVVKRLEGCFKILRGKMATLNGEKALSYSQAYEGDENHLEMVQSLESKQVVAFLVMGENAMEKMRCLVGNEDPKEALLTNHTSLRSLYGVSKFHNGFYYSQTKDCLLVDASYFFSDCPCCTLPSTAVFKDTTCCMIKPHAMKEGIAGRILCDITKCTFKISGFGIFWLTKPQAEEFLQVYRKAFSEADFWAMVDEYCSGPSLVAEITGSPDCPERTQCAFRSFCGPMDPGMARKMRPETLRARYGITQSKNAVHCTDLPEDAVSELEYFFRILDRKKCGIKSVY